MRSGAYEPDRSDINVTVNTAGLGGIPPAAAKRVTVTVTHPSGLIVMATGYRWIERLMPPVVTGAQIGDRDAGPQRPDRRGDQERVTNRQSFIRGVSKPRWND